MANSTIPPAIIGDGKTLSLAGIGKLHKSTIKSKEQQAKSAKTLMSLHGSKK